MNQHYEAFLAKYTSEDTIASYKSDLRLFDVFLQGKDPLLVDKADLDRCISEWQAQKLSDRTIRRRMACLKKFYGRLIRLELIQKDPTIIFDDVKTRVAIRNPKALSIEQIEHLLNCLKWDTIHHWRMSLAVIIGLNTGLRRAEICRLSWADIDFGRKRLITIGKGNKEAYLRMSEELISKLKEYRQKYPEVSPILGIDKTGFDAWMPIIKKKWCQWDGRVKFTSHVLRHSFITMLIRRGVPLDKASTMARHSNPAVTMLYNKQEDKEMDDTFDKAMNK